MGQKFNAYVVLLSIFIFLYICTIRNFMKAVFFPIDLPIECVVFLIFSEIND